MSKNIVVSFTDSLADDPNYTGFDCWVSPDLAPDMRAALTVVYVCEHHKMDLFVDNKFKGKPGTIYFNEDQWPERIRKERGARSFVINIENEETGTSEQVKVVLLW